MFEKALSAWRRAIGGEGAQVGIDALDGLDREKLEKAQTAIETLQMELAVLAEQVLARARAMGSMPRCQSRS